MDYDREMQGSRIMTLSTHPTFQSDCVLYVMSRDQRVQDNHALIAAQARALQDALPLVVLFTVYTKTGVRSREHYQFMLGGLQEVRTQLDTLNIAMIIRTGDPLMHIIDISRTHPPSAIYFDFNPLHGPRKLAKAIASQINVSCYVVDTHNIIPAWVVSDKQEFAAHTMRTKIHRQLEQYLIAPAMVTLHPHTLTTQLDAMTPKQVSAQILPTIAASGIVVQARAGQQAAADHLRGFIDTRLEDYALKRNDIANDLQSGLSPYLHFGQISSLRVALEIIDHVQKEPLLFRVGLLAKSGEVPSAEDGMNALLEEMIVRKELADNYCLHASSYTSISGAHTWAQTTLNNHRGDPRDFTYSLQQWESAQTHDPAWNASQIQLRRSGKIHGYMRMYWAKKILEWSASPEEALSVCIYLNDKYSIDGGDPNGYVGILWSIAGVHDRAWTERPVFGKIRYMNYGGLMRKFDIKGYIKQWS